MACGAGARKDSNELIEMAVSEEDKILFGKWSGTEVTVDGEELLIERKRHPKHHRLSRPILTKFN